MTKQAVDGSETRVKLKKSWNVGSYQSSSSSLSSLSSASLPDLSLYCPKDVLSEDPSTSWRSRLNVLKLCLLALASLPACSAAVMVSGSVRTSDERSDSLSLIRPGVGTAAGSQEGYATLTGKTLPLYQVPASAV